VTTIAKKQLQKQVKCDCKNQFKKLHAAEKESTHKNIAEFQFTNSNKRRRKVATSQKSIFIMCHA
jgi:hypothetical protein